MSQLIDNLNLIVSIKSNIKSAIENKGVDMTGVSFPGYASKIGEISGGGGVNPSGTLEISQNGVYDVYSYASASVNVPQNVTGFTEKDITEGVQIVNLSNSASYVSNYAFIYNNTIQTVNLPYATSVGSNAFANCPNLTSVSLPNCEYVGSSAFNNCTNLQNINLPYVTSVDACVFLNCNSLSQVSLPVCEYVGSSAFNNCTNLQNINIENCLTLSGGGIFNNTKISEINLPKCRRIEGGGVFGNCKSLVSVSLPKCEYLYNQVFHDTVITSVSLPNCKYIRGTIFSNCSLLSSVSLPNCIIISDRFFSRCSSLSVLDLPNVMYIPNGSAFIGSNLISVSLPNCRVIGGIAFQNCSSLTEELNLPACGNIGGAIVNDTNVTKANIPMVISFNKWYGNPVFCTSNFSELHLCIDVYGCPTYSDVISTSTKLHSGEGSIYVNEQNYSYFISASGWSNISSIIYSVSGDSYPLISGSDGLLYGSTKAVGSNYSIYTNINSTNLISISLPNCEYIEPYTFRNCFNLTSVSLPNCEFIGLSAFNGGTNITGFSLPNCKFINGGAFSRCSCSLFTSLTLPNCRYIGGEAFYDCKFLSEIYFPGSEVCFIEQHTMWNTGLTGNILKFYVPASLIDDYKLALWWSSMTSRIFPIPE